MTDVGQWIGFLIATSLVTGLAWLIGLGQGEGFPWGGWGIGMIPVVIGFVRPQWLERRWPKKKATKRTELHPPTDRDS